MSTVTAPSPATNSIRASVGSSTVIDRSFSKKSPPDMCATRALDPDSGQGFIILWGFFWANLLTAAAGRRSELPSRSTGFTAEPRHFANRSRRAFSASVRGSSGKSGMSYPFSCSSSMALWSWGMEALMLGSLMMLASGVFASSPSSAR